MLSDRIRALGSSTFLRSVGTLVGGTVLAQAITALTLPVIARLYSPSDFSLLAVFGGILAVVAVAACLRFDVVIPIPERDEDAVNVLAMSLMWAVVVSVLLALVVLGMAETLGGWLNQPRLAANLWLLPIGVLLAGSYSALQFWCVRKKQFGRIATTRVGQSCAGAGVQIGAGWLGFGPIGLLLGQILSTGAGTIGLGGYLLRDRASLRSIEWTRMRALFRRYDRFPKYSTLEALSNSAGIQLPILLISALVTGPEAGFLLLAMYVIQAPMGVIGGATSQVFLSRAPAEHRAGRLGLLTESVLSGLVRAGVGPLLCLGIVAPGLFAIVFGEEWRRSGVLVSWMTPWFIMQFLAAPVSMALHVANQQKVALVLQVAGLLFRVAAVYGVAGFSRGYVAEAYALSGFVFYFFYLITILRVVAAQPRRVFADMWGSAAVLALWAGGGVALSFAFEFASAIFD